MKRKKLLSAAMVAGLTAAQLAMPVAAADGGDIDVDIDIKTGVIRVEVPTTIDISVDQFELGGKSQIYSQDFSMLNKSPLPVRVEVTSTATLATTTTLVATKAAAEEATDKSVWMAMAAATSKANNAYNYDDVNTEAPEEVRDLTDSSANVTTFDTANKKAKQVFYLAAGSENLSNKVATIADAGKFPLSYAQFYAITETTDLNDSDALVDTDGTKITAAAATQNVVELDANGDVVQYVKKGETSTTGVSTGNKVYVVAATATEANGSTAPAAGGKYLYSEATSAATEGGEAAFSYIGKLADQDEWEVGSGKDFEKINIKYDIFGTGEAVYAELTGDLVYGYYTAPAGPSIATTAYTLTAGQAVEIELNLGAGSKAATAPVSMIWKEKGQEVSSVPGVSYANGVITIGSDIVDGFLDDSATQYPVTMTIKFNDPAGTEIDITMNK